ncbi:hypothetical protein [Paenibacillus elgii]|nr:hypothetical protein [Paenibacillus elgii]
MRSLKQIITEMADYNVDPSNIDQEIKILEEELLTYQMQTEAADENQLS